MFNQYTNYFFDDNALNEIKNKNNKQMKENKTNAENKKKGLYHYQNNPKKEEKQIVDKRFETRTRNAGGGNLGIANTVMEKLNNNANKKKEPNNNKKKYIIRRRRNKSFRKI